MTAYQRTIPSAVLGEYLSDVQRFYDFAEPSPWAKDIKPVLSASILGRNLHRLYGQEVATNYWRWLLERAKNQHSAEAVTAWRRERARIKEERAEAAKVEKPKAPKRRGRRPGRQSVDTRLSDKRLREAMLKAVNHNGRVNRGLRRLANDAGISEASVRRALKAWEASGQLTREGRGRGKTQSIKLDRSHPAWSEYLPSHPRAS